MSRTCAFLALLFSSAVMAVAPWSQVPAPLYRLLPLSVGAPELSAWLLLLAVVAVMLAALAWRLGTGRRPLSRFALLLSIIAAAFPAYVLAQIPGAVRRTDAEWHKTFGKPVSAVSPADARSEFRPHPFTWREMFTGLRTPPVRETGGVVTRTVQGVALRAVIYRPDHDEVVPTVVQLYGGGWRAGEPEDNAPVAKALAAAGFAVFAIDYRHAPEWKWPAQLDDVFAALQWVSEHGAEYGADTARMALLGRSAGAQLAMRASQDPRAPAVRAVVTIYGPVDLTEGYRSPPTPDPLDVRMIESQFLGGTPDERPEAYRDASPITRAAQPHPPVLIITGGRDHIVEPRFGRMLHAELVKSGRSMLVHMPWADHGFDFVPFGPSNQFALYYTQRFLAEALR